MSVYLVRLVALSCVIGTCCFLINRSRATSLPVPNEVIKAALVKELSEKYLDYAQRLLDSSLSVRLIGYEVGPSVSYDPEHNYDHLYKLSDVPRGATLYNVRAKIQITGSKRTMPPDGVRNKLARFLCYKDNYGEFACKLISDEDI